MSRTSPKPTWQLVRHWKINRPTESETPRGFHLSEYLHRLTYDIVQRSPEFAHLRPEQMLFSVTRARKRSLHGLQARLTPLRFRDGHLTRRIRRTTYQVQRYLFQGREILYLVTFCVPRFLDQCFEEKLVTIFHELFHISPDFNGDLRRHDGRYEYHSHSKEGYDQQMASLVARYLTSEPCADLLVPLRLNAADFHEHFGGVYGYHIPRPKMLPVPKLQLYT